MSCTENTCHVRKIHVMYEKYMACMKNTCHVRKIHVIYEKYMSCMKNTCHVRKTFISRHNYFFYIDMHNAHCTSKFGKIFIQLKFKINFFACQTFFDHLISFVQHRHEHFKSGGLKRYFLCINKNKFSE